jgi:hypothetical protein
MVALNGNLSHGEVPASEGTPSLDVIEGCDFTKRSEEVRGGFVVNFGVAGASNARHEWGGPVVNLHVTLE